MNAATYEQVLDAIKSGIPLDIDEFREGYWKFCSNRPDNSVVTKAYTRYIFTFLIPEAVRNTAEDIEHDKSE